jgi:hypothetical protein
MSVQYDTPNEKEQEEEPELPSIASHLERYLEPLLICLDAYLDKRLVRTLVHAIVAILSFRGNQQALQLSELGAYLPGKARKPAKTKRVQRLLMSKKWSKGIVDAFLWREADRQVQQMRSSRREASLYLGWECVRESGKREKRGDQ